MYEAVAVVIQNEGHPPSPPRRGAGFRKRPGESVAIWDAAAQEMKTTGQSMSPPAISPGERPHRPISPTPVLPKRLQRVR